MTPCASTEGVSPAKRKNCSLCSVAKASTHGRITVANPRETAVVGIQAEFQDVCRDRREKMLQNLTVILISEQVLS